jgi:type II secretory pathway pseudopilin PulG
MTGKPAICSDFASRSSKSKHGFSVIEVVVILGIIALLLALMLPAMRSAGPAARRTQCKNNLRNIALALLNYESTYHALPPAYTLDAQGNRLHSWRTLILPFLDEQRLYKKIDLSKAWNDPANAEAFKTTVSAYHCLAADCAANQTTYLAVVASNSCLRPTQPRLLSEITVEPGKALLVIEVESQHAVDWMAPVDADEELVLGFGPKTQFPHGEGTSAAFLDGTVQLLGADMPVTERRALISVTAKPK